MANLKQSDETVFCRLADAGPFGYEPQRFSKGQTKRKHILSNTETDTNEFFLRRGVNLPQWWLKFADGHPVTHVYRLIDDDNGLDTKFPKVTEAMSHKLKPEAVVDFSDKQVKQQALKHVDKK